MKTVVCWVSLLFFLAIPTASQTQERVPLGVILPLTGDGAFWGQNPKQGIELALEDIKLVSKETKIRFVFEDDRCSAKDAVAAFHKLVEVDHVKMILGPSCSSAAAAVAPLAEKHRVIMLVFAESDEIRTGTYVRRLWIPNSLQGRRLAQYAFDRKFRSVAVVATQNAFGLSISESFSRKFTALGGTIVAHQEYDPSTTTFRSHLIRVVSAKPDALFFASYIKDGAILVRQARAIGLTQPLLGPSTINSPEFFDATKSYTDGLALADLEDSSTAEFKERWRERFKSNYPGIQSGAPLFYDMTMLIEKHLQQHDIETLGEYLRLVDYSGASGRIRFTSDGNLDRQHVLYRVQAGILERVPEASKGID
jgi:branched-chain amino acid transport system substrate-binding protein